MMSVRNIANRSMGELLNSQKRFAIIPVSAAGLYSDFYFSATDNFNQIKGL